MQLKRERKRWLADQAGRQEVQPPGMFFRRVSVLSMMAAGIMLGTWFLVRIIYQQLPLRAAIARNTFNTVSFYTLVVSIALMFLCEWVHELRLKNYRYARRFA